MRYIYSFMIMLSAIFTACQAELLKDKPECVGEVDFSIRKSPCTSAKAGYGEDDENGLQTFWTVNDNIGITMVKDMKPIGFNYPYTVRYIDEVGNAQLNAVSSRFRSDEVPGTTIYAYYPYDSSLQQDNISEIPVSLPSVQTVIPGSPSALSDYAVFKADPQTVGTEVHNIELSFYNAFTIIEFRMKYSSQSGIKHNVVKMRLSSVDGSALSADKAIIDLSSSKADDAVDSPVDILSSSGMIEMNILGGFVLSDTEVASVFLMALPGHHDASSLKLELYTDDYRKCEYVIPAEIDFRSNTRCIHSFEIDPDSFRFHYEPEPGEKVYKYIPVEKASEITAGEHVLVYKFWGAESDDLGDPVYDDDYEFTRPVSCYAMRCDYMTRNYADNITSLDMVWDDDGNIFKVDDLYVWEISVVEGGFKIGFEDDKGKWYMCGANSTTLQVRQTPTASESDVWFVDIEAQGDRIRPQSLKSNGRMLMLNRLTQTGYTMTKWNEEKTGRFIFYKKTEVNE